MSHRKFVGHSDLINTMLQCKFHTTGWNVFSSYKEQELYQQPQDKYRWKSQNEGYNRYMSERWASNIMVYQRMAISITITLLTHNIKVKRVSLLLHIWRSCVQRGTQWCSWLRHCGTSQKIVGSIPDGIIEIFHWHNPSSHTMALGSTQPLTEMSTRNISWVVKAAGS